VRQLVGQHHPPVEGPVARRLRGDDAAEADARDADRGQTGRADRELVRFAKKLQHHGRGWLDPIAGDVIAVALLEERRDDLGDRGAVGGRDAEAQARDRQCRVARRDRLLVEVEEVVGPYVVRIALPGAAQGLETLGLVAEAEQRHRQLRQAVRVIGIGGDALARDVARVVVPTVVGQRLRDEREEGAVVGAHGEVGGALAFVAGPVVQQQRGGGRDARRADVARVGAPDRGHVGRGA